MNKITYFFICNIISEHKEGGKHKYETRTKSAILKNIMGFKMFQKKHVEMLCFLY